MQIKSMAFVSAYERADGTIGWFFGFPLNAGTKDALIKQGVPAEDLANAGSIAKCVVERELLDALKAAGWVRRTELTFDFVGFDVEPREDDKTKFQANIVSLLAVTCGDQTVELELDLDKLEAKAHARAKAKAEAAAKKAAQGVTLGA